MLLRPELGKNPMMNESRKTVQVRQKIKEVFGWDCVMKDDVLLKYYTITSDGELIVIVR
jgi:hypothetical protein